MQIQRTAKSAAADLRTLGQIIMRCRYQSNWIVLLIAAILVAGCATTKTPYWQKTAYGTWKFSHSEIRKLPNISIRNILSAVSTGEVERVQILVNAQGLDGVAKVSRMAGQEDVYVTEPNGQEVKINISQITEIQSIRQIRITPRQKTTGEVAEEWGEFLFYVPLIPLGIVSWPLLEATGLDSVKNDADKGKAMMAYGGMSKEELIAYIGKPMEKYYCESEYGDQEIWIYEKSQVLRGGRALFINLDDGSVYHTSHDTSFFKDSKFFNCSILRG